MTRWRSLTECARTRRLGHHADALAAARRPPADASGRGRWGAAGCRCARRSLAARRLARLVRYLKRISSVCTVHCVTLTVSALSRTLVRSVHARWSAVLTVTPAPSRAPAAARARGAARFHG